MLCLNRKLNERIVIGENIVVEVVRIAGNRVRIGIAAPEDVPIVRGETRTGHGRDRDPQPPRRG